MEFGEDGDHQWKCVGLAGHRSRCRVGSFRDSYCWSIRGLGGVCRQGTRQTTSGQGSLFWQCERLEERGPLLRLIGWIDFRVEVDQIQR